MNVEVEFHFAEYPRKFVPFSVCLTFNIFRKSACDITFHTWIMSEIISNFFVFPTSP